MAAWLALLPVIEGVLDRVLPDPEQKAKAIIELKKQEQDFQIEVSKLELEATAQQTDINKIEAGSSDPFVSRARPFIMWVCGVAFAYHFVAQPLLAFLLSAAGHKVDLPAFDMEALNTVLMGLLGLGAMRSFDKFKGTSR